MIFTNDLGLFFFFKIFDPLTSHIVITNILGRWFVKDNNKNSLLSDRCLAMDGLEYSENSLWILHTCGGQQIWFKFLSSGYTSYYFLVKT